MNDVIIQKIELILGNAFNINNYVELISEIFPSFQTVAPYNINKEYSNFSSHIEGYAHVGTFQTPDKKKIIIMAVQLKKAGYVENSRSTHRSFAKKLIENGNADAAFIAFYTEDDPKWRLSLVRLDYEMKIENGRLKTAENLTPAKRYSYLVGKNEPCHTSIKQFHRFITDSTAHPEYPTLDALENAFSVEKVTNEFFNLYCEKFHQLREQLETIEDFRIEAEQHNFTSAQFAKKLMGQIVFLYFLQKKGWLGVKAWPETLNEKEYKNAFFARGAKSRELIPIVYRPVGDGTYKISSAGLNSISDADEEVLAQCVKGKPWGSGPHDFMRKLFEHAIKKKINFFNELLEPLFYDALNRNRGEQGYCPALHCRIPFLSGGLFEPIDGYDWEHNDFSIPNEVFSNAAEKGRDADGILDIFDRYNFTMSEDEPMEREVAIDPEMLGKVFENLLEINDRKSKGAFYTPREIVHYMCQESLINYLTNALSLSEEAIRDFILYGDFMKDEDTIKEKRQGNGGMYISEELYKINPDGTVAVNRLLDMDKALKDVRIADPAVGSGAFPLGMLNEIVRARQNISAYLAITKSNKDKHWMYQMERSPHTLKYETIRNCIFACDIEPSAVDIAQLRLWLALVIDDEINPNAQNDLEGHRNPLPLPNLESNIICGNSLIDEFEGIRLIKESDLLGSTGAYQRDFNSDRFDSIIRKLIETQDELFRCDNTEKKKQLKEQIDSLRDMIILTQLEGCGDEKIQRYYETKSFASKPYTLWQLDFARVFREKGGFDIVIGNPPYVQIPKGTVNKDRFPYAEGRDKGKQNLYKLFVEHAYNICATNGHVALIVQSSLMCDLSSMYTRQLLLDKTCLRQVIEFPKKSSDAKGQVFDGVLQGTCITIFEKALPEEDATFGISIGNNTRTIDCLVFETMEQSYIRKIYPESLYIPLIKPGEFKILEKILSKSNILLEHMQGISQGDLNLTGAKSHFSNDVTSVSLLRGRHVGRYYIHNDSNEYVEEGYLSEKVYANRKNTYLVGQEITGTIDEWRLHFALTQHEYDFLFGHTSNKILLKKQDENLFILGVLNSKLQDWFFRKTSTNNHVMGYELKQLPIPKVTSTQFDEITATVEEIIKCMYRGDAEKAVISIKHIDNIIYSAYGLTSEEIQIVEA